LLLIEPSKCTGRQKAELDALIKEKKVRQRKDTEEGGNYMAKNKGVRVAKCPIGQDYCYPSCYFRKGNRCYFRSKRGRHISKLRSENQVTTY
jgi:nitroimidazol reductase NimA-like FMN-containing flavoprotein (pyridoxamine 5'-phosphate oxidase superfamily)